MYGELRDRPWTDPETAYSLSKACGYDRMCAATIPWAGRGARLNSITPGGVATSMGRLSMDKSETARAMLAITPMERIGTPDDIAMAVEFLAGPRATYVTGSDLLVDGGLYAAARYGPSPSPR